MDSLSIIGTVKKISEAIKKTDRFTVRYLLIETPGEYPQLVEFQASNDKVSLFDTWKPGDKIEVFFNIRGNEWEGKVFNNLVAWKITQQVSAPVVDGSDDLPF